MMLKNIIECIDENKAIDVNLGAFDKNIDQSIRKYNELIFKRLELLKNLMPENEKITNIEYQLKETQNNLIQSLNNTILATEEELSELIENERKVVSRMSMTPLF